MKIYDGKIKKPEYSKELFRILAPWSGQTIVFILSDNTFHYYSFFNRDGSVALQFPYIHEEKIHQPEYRDWYLSRGGEQFIKFLSNRIDRKGPEKVFEPESEKIKRWDSPVRYAFFPVKEKNEKIYGSNFLFELDHENILIRDMEDFEMSLLIKMHRSHDYEYLGRLSLSDTGLRCGELMNWPTEDGDEMIEWSARNRPAWKKGLTRCDVINAFENFKEIVNLECKSFPKTEKNRMYLEFNF